MKKTDFNYLDHYKTDAEEFDYFEERSGATAHDERRLREYIISEISIKKGRILDVGAGSAWVAEHFTKLGFEVISMDISLINLQKAKQKIPSNLHNCVSSDAFNLPYKSGSFDIVISSEVIEHVFNPEEFVKELSRVVKKGGSLIITTPYKEKLQYSLCIHCNKKTPLHAHIHSFDEKILAGLFKGVQHSKVEWETFGNKILIFTRSFVILKYFPYALWKFKDKVANLIYNIPAHIIVKCTI
jgi:ubiquinone/menaquinone biosynthesis C-methylase UbiE